MSTEPQRQSKQALRNLQRRLDRQALDQLRDEVVSLNRQLEAAIARAERAEYELGRAVEDADQWHDIALDAMYHDCEAENPQIGLTQQGHLVALPAAHTDPQP